MFRVDVETRGGVFNGATRSEVLRKAYLKHLVGAGILFQGAVEPNTPYGVSGKLQKGWSVKRDGDDAVVVENSEEYALAVELGRQPGKGIPLEPLELWIRRVIGMTDPEEISSFALNISRKAKYRGLEGKEFAQKTFDQVRPDLDAELEKIGAFIVRGLQQ